jgi:putative sigma-54 modulation protein
MDIRVKAKNTEVTEAVKEAAVAKLSRLERYFRGLLDLEVELGEERNPRVAKRQVVEVTIRTKGPLVRARAAAQDWAGALDLVVEKLQRQLEKVKGRIVEAPRHHSSPTENSFQLAAARGGEEGEPLSRVVRVKRFDLKPMTTEEAIEQMELLGHDFFFFRSSESGKYGVLYRRRAGGLGLIEADG